MCYCCFDIVRADRQQMMDNAAPDQMQRPGSTRPDDSRVGLIDNEGQVMAEPFIGQNFQK